MGQGLEERAGQMLVHGKGVGLCLIASWEWGLTRITPCESHSTNECCSSVVLAERRQGINEPAMADHAATAGHNVW